MASVSRPQPRGLIVEDAGAVRDLLRDALGQAGFEADTAETATEAIDHLATRRYAVIVADCILPDLPTLDWLAALRGAAPTTPLILQSGGIGPEELAGYAAEFGVAGVLEKPFSVGQLLAAVRAAVETG